MATFLFSTEKEKKGGATALWHYKKGSLGEKTERKNGLSLINIRKGKGRGEKGSFPPPHRGKRKTIIGEGGEGSYYLLNSQMGGGKEGG